MASPHGPKQEEGQYGVDDEAGEEDRSLERVMPGKHFDGGDVGDDFGEGGLVGVVDDGGSDIDSNGR